jgi:methyl-accepting chemotaxis protein
VTQQNAALVEQAAAAAESLEEQAATLSETVAQFRLDSDGRPPVQHRPTVSQAVKNKPAVRPATIAAKPRISTNISVKPKHDSEDAWVDF